MIYLWAVGLFLFLALALNVPLGAWRKAQRKFSPAWFLGIHASIPFLFLARLELDLAYWVIPIEVAFVVAGQVAGSHVRSRLRPFEATAEARIGVDP